MQKTGLLIAVAVTLLIATNCETVVDVKLPNSEKKVVVNSLIGPDTTLWVHITQSIQPTDSIDFLDINNAEVTIIENGNIEHALQKAAITRQVVIKGDDNTTTSRLTDTVFTYYKIPNVPAKPGIFYELTVSSPDFPTVNATEIIPSTVPFEIEEITKSVDESCVGCNEQHVLNVTISFDDEGSSEDFYHFEVFKREKPRAGSPDDHKPFKWLPISFESADPALFGTPSEDLFFDDEKFSKTYSDDAFFSDDQFNGKKKLINFEIQRIRGDSVNGAPPAMKFELKHVSENFFKYIKSTTSDALFANTPFEEPKTVFSNIENGYGIFAGFSVEKIYYQIDTDEISEEEPL